MTTFSRVFRAPRIKTVLPPTLPALPIRRKPFVVSKPALLIVEENEEMREHFKHFLQEEYWVTIRANAVEAIKEVSKSSFDLIVYNVEYGKEAEAVAALNRIRRIPSCKELPIIALTGYMLPLGKSVLKRAQFSDKLARPFTLKQLRETIRRNIAKRVVALLNTV